LWCVVDFIRHLKVRRVASLTRVVLVFVCGLKRDRVVVVCVVGLVVSLFFVAPFSLRAVFSYASAFADNTFFCAGSWSTSVIRASDFDNSGVTEFSCSNTVLHNVMFKSVVDDWCGTDAAKKTAVQTAHGSIEDWDVSRITNMNSLFKDKSSFNADLSKWSTGAVTNMQESKCTLSSSLLATAPFVVVGC
jgi:surface protein